MPIAGNIGINHLVKSAGEEVKNWCDGQSERIEKMHTSQEVGSSFHS